MLDGESIVVYWSTPRIGTLGMHVGNRRRRFWIGRGVPWSTVLEPQPCRLHADARGPMGGEPIQSVIGGRQMDCFIPFVHL